MYTYIEYVDATDLIVTHAVIMSLINILKEYSFKDIVNAAEIL